MGRVVGGRVDAFAVPTIRLHIPNATEAEVLSSRIGIMVHGRLDCIGTAQRLKQRFGGGYMLLMNFAEGRREAAMGFIRAAFPGAVLVRNFTNQVSLRIPGGPAEGQECTSMSFPFSTMLGASHGNQITTWAVSLEEGPKGEHGQFNHFVIL